LARHHFGGEELSPAPWAIRSRMAHTLRSIGVSAFRWRTTMLDEIFAQFAHDPNFDKKPADALSCDNDDDGSTLDHGRIADALTPRQFITAEKATVTLKSLKSGARFTYRITAAKDENGDRSGDGTLFVGLLNGPNNDGDYKY